MTRWNEKYHDKYKAYSLYGKMLIPERHEEAWKKVRANLGSPGTDEVTIGMFEKQKDKHIDTIIRKLRSKEYQPKPVKR